METRRPLSPAATAFLRRQGMELVSVFDSAALEPAVGNGLDGNDPGEWPTLILLGNRGPAMWYLLRERAAAERDPFDRHAAEVSAALVRDHLGGVRFRLLYPGPTGVALQRLAEAAGWGRPSLLGLSIHPVHGTWFACRALLLAACRLLPSAPAAPVLPDLCASCSGQPCRSACPVAAPRAVGGFDLQACIDRRLAPQSACAYDCAARRACPVGEAYRYDDAQIAWHAGRALDSIRRWVAGG